ncbi:MAG: DUF2628 domain-containing protein [Rhodospirillales bacterium]|nr:DUF2628 domain-containing protein [Rhodospirillales bacterium]
MRMYTAYVRHGGLDPDRDVVLVKEGFSWPAFVFGPLWALTRRLWLTAVAFAFVLVGLEAAMRAFAFDGIVSAALILILSVAFGWLGNDLRRRKLERRGFVFRGVVAGNDIDAALARFLDSTPGLARDLASTVRP